MDNNDADLRIIMTIMWRLEEKEKEEDKKNNNDNTWAYIIQTQSRSEFKLCPFTLQATVLKICTWMVRECFEHIEDVQMLPACTFL